jgi:nucleoid-associated protein YgaU
MKSEAKVGLGIVLGAVLLSALLIGRAISYKDKGGVTAPGEQGTAQLQLPPVPAASDSGSGAEDPMDALIAGLPDTRDVALPGSGPVAGNDPAASAVAAAGGRTTNPWALTGGNDGALSAVVPAGSAATNEFQRPAGRPALPVGRRDGTEARPETVGADFTYSVQQNDNAWKISQRFYGNGKHWKKIVEANSSVDFDNLQVGVKLTIPGRTDAGAATAAVTAGPSEAAPLEAGLREVTVEAGDSPFRLAEKHLGSGMRYGEILKLNPDLDPRRLRVGQKLRIPAR